MPDHDALLHPHDPPDKVLIETVLDALHQGVIFLVASEIEPEDVERLVKKTSRLATGAIFTKFGKEASSKFFLPSDNSWVLKTAFGGWIFFYPVEVLTPTASMEQLGDPDFVYWPDVEGAYARVPYPQWTSLRQRGDVYRPTGPQPKGPRSIWQRLAEK